MRVCVIGAGSSGLTALKNLREHGHDAIAFEREDDVGGNWSFGKPNSRVYATTHMISSKPFTGYPDFPMADEWPDYLHHSQVLEYLQRYARHFDLYAHTRFGTAVERVARAPGGGWEVTVTPREGGPERHAFDAVVIANGHNWYPKIPEIPGADSFQGKILHSAEYKRPDVLDGKRVLVVGAGNTGCDVAVDAATRARRTLHSTRRGYWYAPKYAFGKPADQLYALLLSLPLPLSAVRFLLERTAKLTSGDVSRFGLPAPDHRILETHPIVNSQLLYHLGHGDIEPRGDVARFDGKRVVFVDGRTDEVDLVVFCTGYLIRFPFLDADELPWRGERPTLYKNVFHPERDDLFVIGLIQPDSGQFTLVHWQSVAVALFLSLRESDPARAGRFLEAARAQIGEHLGAGIQYKESTRHLVEVQHMTYLRGLARVVESLSA